MLKKIALLFALLIVPVTACTPIAGPAIGATAPSIELFNLDNQMIRLSDFLGRPVVVNFWGTQCDFCITEMPDLETAFRQESAKADGAVFLAINVQDTAAATRAFMNNYDYTIPVLMDAGARTANAYNVFGIPVTFFIDRTGIIRYIQQGMFLSLDDINAALDTIR